MRFLAYSQNLMLKRQTESSTFTSLMKNDKTRLKNCLIQFFCRQKWRLLRPGCIA